MRKQILLLAIFIVAVNILNAQSENPFVRKVDSITVNLDKNYIATGILYDRVPPLAYGIKIMDATGVLRSFYEHKKGINSTTISLSGINTGLYLVSAFDGQNWNSKQLVIQK